MSKHNINVIFYSDRCNACKNLIQIMKNKGLFEYFKPVCVDQLIGKLPKEITMVPTLIISGIEKPLVSKEAFKWVDEANMVMTNKIIEREVNGIHSTEYNDFTDKYTFKDKDELFEKSYIKAEDNGKQVIFTVPEQKAIDNQIQSILTKDLLSKRNKQEVEIKQMLRDSR